MPSSGSRVAMGGWRPVATRQCGSGARPSAARDSGALQVWHELWLSPQQGRVGWRGSEGLWGCAPCQMRDVPSAGLPARPVALLFEITHCGSGCFPGMAESWQLDRRFVLSPVLAEEGCNTCACDFHLSFHNSFSVAICVSLSASAVTHHRACYTGLCQG